jgi:O-antigen/teichoic acid export membrane protein
MTRSAEAGSMAGNSARLLAAQVLANSGYFASVLLLARALAPAERGTIAFVTVISLLLGRLTGVGMAEATNVLAAQRPGRRATLLANVLLVSAVGALAGAAVVCGVLIAFPRSRPAGVGGLEMAVIVAGALVTSTSYGAASFLQGCSRFRDVARLLVVGPWLYALLLALTWVTWRLDVDHAAVAWAVAQGVPALLACVASARGSGIGRPDRLLLTESIRFGARAWVGSLSHLFNARTDQVLIALLSSEGTLGVYAVAVNASEVLFYLPAAAAVTLVPAVARSTGAGSVERTLRVFRAVTVVTAASVMAAALMGPVLLPIVFGRAYGPAVEPFLWLLPGAVGFGSSTVFSGALLASGAPGLSSLGPVISLVVGTALDVVLIPRFGASGAAAAASAALLAGGAAAAIAYGARAGLGPSALVPRRADVAALASLPSRRAGTRPS